MDKQTTASFFRAVALAGLLAGTLDISLASLDVYITYNMSPGRLLRYIAGAAFGQATPSGGIGEAVWGLLFHYFIAFSFTLLFFLIYPLVSRFSSSPVINGMVYAIFIWLVMNLAVLPLTKLPPRNFRFPRVLLAIVILMVAIGIPVSYFARRYYVKTQPANP